MTDDKANTVIDKIVKSYESDGASAEKTVPMLQDLRQIAKANEDPLIIRVLRHTCEHITENEGFELNFFEETYDEEEDGEEMIDDQDSFVYLLELIKQSDNTVNRQEIRSYVELLK